MSKLTSPQSSNTQIDPQPFSPANTAPTKAKFVHKPILYGLLILLLSGGTLLWYIFSAKSVVIQTTPAYSDLNIAGRYHFNLGDHLLLLPGSYQLSASLPDHYPLDQSFVVTEAQNQSLSFNFVRLPGYIHLNIDPKVAVTVTVDQQPIAYDNQQSAPIEAGAHQIRVAAPRYLPFDATVNVGGRGRTQTLEVNFLPAWGDVSINSDPTGAEIFNADKLLGVTPLESELLAGIHRLTFKKSGYQPIEREVKVAAGTTQTLELAKMFKLEGRLVVTTEPAGVSVTYGNKYLGTTPLDRAVVPNKAMPLLLFKDGYQQQSHRLTIASGKTLRRTFRLISLMAQVSFNVTPNDALLYVDGQLKGSANQQLSLLSKQHKIRIERQGYQTYYSNVLPNPKMVQRVAVRLKTTEQAKWENIKPQITTLSGVKLKLFKPNDTFVMGASRREQGRRANETRRTIHLNRAFYLGITEVTNKQYLKFQRAHSSGHVKGNSLNGFKQPAVKVSWLDAAKYCNWLSAQENLTKVYHFEQDQLKRFDPAATGYRLPTEAEWVWATRYISGKMLKYSWGSSLPPTKDAGNFADIAGASILGFIQTSYNDNYITTAPVASF
ncbi:MAG: PEGA domain-containing protein, partial [Gammaproteobacteria bacterium]|nr:PEGA domain-containing protein [Gammaproteobacteria bacterium]